MAWKHSGADPYRLFNSLDERYRPMTERHPCPACYTMRDPTTPCPLCHGQGSVEFPLAEPGEPKFPSHPSRVRAFIYACGVVANENDAGEDSDRGQRMARRAERLAA